MVLYVAYRASRESKDRSLIPKRLSALGCKRLHRSFWKIDEKKTNRVIKVLEKNQPILLKRIRQIKKPRFADKKKISDLGSLIIVMYATPKEPKREKIRNYLRTAPCIRLCRSVYAFPQKHALFDKDNKLVDAQKFSEFIKEIHQDVRVIPRVVVVDTDSIEKLVQETRERIESEFADATSRWKELYERILRGDDTRLLKDLYLRNRRRFVRARRVAAFYEKWLRIDTSRSLMRSYREMRKTRTLLSEREPLQTLSYKIHK
ncbi:MAG: hypothetical protein JSW01_03535 [Candidatus Bathyarchaeota archaeon]|nr:MAG: hypothetical protein JSW01_03535 [Candidatus Bathyarchaeota archaeon]